MFHWNELQFTKIDKQKEIAFNISLNVQLFIWQAVLTTEILHYTVIFSHKSHINSKLKMNENYIFFVFLFFVTFMVSTSLTSLQISHWSKKWHIMPGFHNGQWCDSIIMLNWQWKYLPVNQSYFPMFSTKHDIILQ